MGSWQSLGVHNPVDVLLLLTNGSIMSWATRRGKYRLMRPNKHGDYSALHTTGKDDLPGEDNEHNRRAWLVRAPLVPPRRSPPPTRSREVIP